MYNGVKAMIEREKELTPKKGPVQAHSIDPTEPEEDSNDIIQCGPMLKKV
jgi:hypothetical protein